MTGLAPPAKPFQHETPWSSRVLQHGNHQSGSARKKSEHDKYNPLPVTVAAASHSQSDFLGNSSGSRKTTPAEHAHPTNLAAGLGLSVSQKQNQQSTHAHSKHPNLLPSENGQNPFERHSVWSGELTSVCHRMSRLGNRPMHHSTHLAHLPPPRLTDPPPLCQAPLRPLSAVFVCHSTELAGISVRSMATMLLSRQLSLEC